MFNNEASYARSRIVASFMRGKDQLYQIIDISSKTDKLDEATIYALTSDGQKVALKSSSLEFTLGKLGYVNEPFTGIAQFLSRIPLRRDFRQGLRACQLVTCRNGSANSVPDKWLASNSKAVYKCLVNDYPKISRAIELVDEYDGDIAFSKNFAIGRNYSLLYRGFSIGKLTKDDKLKLDNKFNFVEEELVKEIGHDYISR
jgi:hypothetical protein